MMDYMYKVPSDESITELTITKDIVDENMILEDKKNAEVLNISDKKEEESA
jgi:ATP-dependent Clp protease ATP-binding subunit ClpX